MTAGTSSTVDLDRYGLSLGKHNSERRAALVDPDTGDHHVYKLTDAEVARRIVEGAFSLMRIHSNEGRVFIDHDGAIKLSMAMNAIAMSRDSIDQFDGIREGKFTLAAIDDIMKVIQNAATQQHNAMKLRAAAEAQANAAAYPRRQAATPGATNEPLRQSQ